MFRRVMYIWTQSKLYKDCVVLTVQMRHYEWIQSYTPYHLEYKEKKKKKIKYEWKKAYTWEFERQTKPVFLNWMTLWTKQLAENIRLQLYTVHTVNKRVLRQCTKDNNNNQKKKKCAFAFAFVIVSIFHITMYAQMFWFLLLVVYHLESINKIYRVISTRHHIMVMFWSLCTLCRWFYCFIWKHRPSIGDSHWTKKNSFLFYICFL